MDLQTFRLQNNLPMGDDFQIVHSDKYIQADACKSIISQKYR